MKTLIGRLIILIIISVLLSGCIQEKPIGENTLDNNRTIKYIENNQPIITKEDFPDFDLEEYVHFVSADNLTVSLYTESSHGGFVVNGSEYIPEGFRVYGSSETYNSSQRYLLLQYKVFDENEKLNDSINMTVFNYIKSGFISKSFNNSKYKQRIFVLESDMENINSRRLEDIKSRINATNNISIINDTNVTNITKIKDMQKKIKDIEKNMTLSDKDKNMNVTYILFGYDALIGRIAVKDSKDKSLNESLKILDITLDRLKIGSKNVSMANISMFGNKKNISARNIGNSG